MSLEDKITFNEPLEYRAACSKDAENTSRAASGGVFWELAKATIECGGVVFGSVLEDDGACHHAMASTLDELMPMQGSKYVWSSIGKCYEQCAEALTTGKKVLFTGTPCQIAGLQAYLNKESHKVQGISELRENLITVDLFCHGTPPQKLFKAYIKWLNYKHKTDNGIHGYTFRSKLKGWGPDIFSYHYSKNGKQITKWGYANNDPYYAAYLNCLYHQKKCYSCKYAQKKRCSDISIGDFWGIENHFPDFYNAYKQSGISAILINTNNGKQFFKNVSERFFTKQATYKTIKQPSIEASYFKLGKKIDEKLYEIIHTSLKTSNFGELFGKILKPKTSAVNHLKSFASKILPEKAKTNIKKAIQK